MKIFFELWKPLAIAGFFAACIFAPVGYMNNSKRKQPTPMVSIQKPFNIEDMKQLIESMPNSALKANFYIILATEYAGNSDELHAILNEFAKMQLEKLHNKDTI